VGKGRKFTWRLGLYFFDCERLCVVIVSFSTDDRINYSFNTVPVANPLGTFGENQLISPFWVPTQTIRSFMQLPFSRPMHAQASTLNNFLEPTIVLRFNARQIQAVQASYVRMIRMVDTRDAP
jgi:hypothetical protein